MNERSELVVRAAAGYEDLTPRPDYAKLIDLNSSSTVWKNMGFSNKFLKNETQMKYDSSPDSVNRIIIT